MTRHRSSDSRRILIAARDSGYGRSVPAPGEPKGWFLMRDGDLLMLVVPGTTSEAVGPDPSRASTVMTFDADFLRFYQDVCRHDSPTPIEDLI